MSNSQYSEHEEQGCTILEKTDIGSFCDIYYNILKNDGKSCNFFNSDLDNYLERIHLTHHDSTVLIQTKMLMFFLQPVLHLLRLSHVFLAQLAIVA